MIDQKSKIRSQRITLLAMCLLVLFWMLDAAVDAHLFGEETYIQQRELAIRIIFALLFIAFIFYIRRVMLQRDALEAALQSALDDAEAEKERTTAIVSAMGDGISIQDTDLKVLYQNDAHKALVGDHVVNTATVPTK